MYLTIFYRTHFQYINRIHIQKSSKKKKLLTFNRFSEIGFKKSVFPDLDFRFHLININLYQIDFDS